MLQLQNIASAQALSTETSLLMKQWMEAGHSADDIIYALISSAKFHQVMALPATQYQDWKERAAKYIAA